MRQENSDKAVDETFTMHLHQWFGNTYSLLGKARPLASCYDCVFHECLMINCNDNLLKHFIYTKLINVITYGGTGVEFLGYIKLGIGIVP